MKIFLSIGTPTAHRASWTKAIALGLALSLALPALAEPPPPQKLPEAGTNGGQPAAATAIKPPPPPDTPAKRARRLRDLYAELATAADEDTAAALSQQIERLWLLPASETVGVLMDRANRAAAEQRLDLALNLLQAATELAPDYAEAWNRRAYVHYLANDIQRSLGDLRRALALDPNHFKALDGLGQILKELGEKKAALDVFRQLVAVHPFWSGGAQAVQDLTRELDGRSL